VRMWVLGVQGMPEAVEGPPQLAPSYSWVASWIDIEASHSDVQASA